MIVVTEEARKRASCVRLGLLSWAETGLRKYPWRTNRTPYSVMVAEFLLKRTTAPAVNRMFEQFMKRYPEISALYEANHNDLKESLQAIGYHKLRAREIKKTAAYIVEVLGGEIPKDLSKLLMIPNVGPYTASAILSLGYGIPASMVDSNVERIINRVFRNCMSDHQDLKTVKQIVDILLPAERHDIFSLALIDLGGTICTYRKTICEKCPINRCCDIGARTEPKNKSV